MSTICYGNPSKKLEFSASESKICGNMRRHLFHLPQTLRRSDEFLQNAHFYFANEKRRLGNTENNTDSEVVMQGKVEICGVNTARLKTLKNEEMATSKRDI